MNIKLVNNAVKLKLALIHARRRFGSTPKDGERIFDLQRKVQNLTDAMTNDERAEFAKRLKCDY